MDIDLIALALSEESQASAKVKIDWEQDFVRLQQRADSEAAWARLAAILTAPFRHLRRRTARLPDTVLVLGGPTQSL